MRVILTDSFDQEKMAGLALRQDTAQLTLGNLDVNGVEAIISEHRGFVECHVSDPTLYRYLLHHLPSLLVNNDPGDFVMIPGDMVIVTSFHPDRKPFLSIWHKDEEVSTIALKFDDETTRAMLKAVDAFSA